MNKERLFLALKGLGLSTALALSGAYLIAPWEGEVRTVYVDPVGIKTVCYGHTGGYVKEGKQYTGEDCIKILAEDIASHNREMRKYIQVPLTIYQEAALTSFCFNIGVNACRKSTAFKLLNRFDYSGACAQLKRWVFAGKKALPGLISRRGDEYQVCMGQMKGLPLEVISVR